MAEEEYSAEIKRIIGAEDTDPITVQRKLLDAYKAKNPTDRERLTKEAQDLRIQWKIRGADTNLGIKFKELTPEVQKLLVDALIRTDQDAAQKFNGLLEKLRDRQQLLLEKQLKDMFDLQKAGVSPAIGLLGTLKSFAHAVKAFMPMPEIDEFITNCDAGINAELAKVKPIDERKMNDVQITITSGAPMVAGGAGATAAQNYGGGGAAPTAGGGGSSGGSGGSIPAPAAGPAVVPARTAGRGSGGGADTTASAELTTTEAIQRAKDAAKSSPATIRTIMALIEENKGELGDPKHLSAGEISLIGSQLNMRAARDATLKPVVAPVMEALRAPALKHE